MFEWVHLEYIFRVLLAGICGIAVGLERRNRSKEAGIRTHFVVACGAALMMVISKYAFFDIIESGTYANMDVRLDPSRIASTIASGIGFLGAGMIFVHKNTISGLTTAAGIWATSGVGMAIGAGLYLLGVSATVILLLAQILLHLRVDKKKRVKRFTVKDVTEDGFQEYLTNELTKMHIRIQDISVERVDGVKSFTYLLEVPYNLQEEDILALTKYSSSIRSSL